MKNGVAALWVFFLGISLAGCSTMSATNSSPNPDSSKEYIGIFSGAIIGGLAGSAIGQKGGGRLTATGLGAVTGAIVGFFLGKYLGDLDRQPQAHYGTQAKSRVQTSNWKQPVNPLTPQQNTTFRTTPAKTVLTQAAQDKRMSPKTEKPQPSPSAADQFLSLWKTLPSTQWFVNDMKQQELG